MLRLPRVRTCLEHSMLDIGGIRRKVLDKTACERLRSGIEFRWISPGRLWVEHLRWHARASDRPLQSKDWVGLYGDVVELAGKRGADNRPGVGQADPLADSVRAAGPPGVHQPDVPPVLRDPLAQQVRVRV